MPTFKRRIIRKKSKRTSKRVTREICQYSISSKKSIHREGDIHIYLMSSLEARSHVAFLKKEGLDSRLFPKSIWTDFQGRVHDSVVHHLPDRVIHLVGYGGKEGGVALREVAVGLGRLYANEHKSNKNIIFHLTTSNPLLLQHQVDGFVYGHYQFNMYKTGLLEAGSHTHSPHPHKIVFYHPSLKIRTGLEKALVIAKVRSEIRDLINMPANELDIPTYVRLLRKSLPTGVKMRVMTEAQLKREGLNLILAVNRGGRNKAAMVILEYGKKKSSRPICLVGKGVMYDTGGYDLKHSFTNCHFDMTGSAVAYGVLKSLALFRSPQHVMAFLPLVENDISENAYKTGDIIKSYSGLTVEIGDTDAEGRLILADAMAYAGKYRPKICIDMGTLSGEAAHIFQERAAVVMGHDHRLNQKMVKVGELYQEHVWELPMWDVYLESTRASKVADLRSVSEKPGAMTIFIGAFLSHFVPKDSNWIHMDIAGVDSEEGLSTGTILQTLTHFVQHNL